MNAFEMNDGESAVTQIGARLLLDDSLNVCGQTFADQRLAAHLNDEARSALEGGRSVKRVVDTHAGRAEIFFDVIAPPRPLIIFGAERDAEPLAQLARMLGWHITVVDTRARHATPERFRDADQVILCRAEEIAARVPLTPETAAVLMTHNYLDDVELLRTLLPSHVSYLGILGPKQRARKLFADLRAEGFTLTDEHLARLHSPIGMDIGAETPEEIALAIIAEIKAACAARRGGFLRDRAAPLHADSAPLHDDDVTNPATIEISIEPHPSMRESASVMVCYSS
jgi:xanthine/CO dehydrogenase XdhC/CoxF family maturation factor